MMHGRGQAPLREQYLAGAATRCGFDLSRLTYRTAFIGTLLFLVRATNKRPPAPVRLDGPIRHAVGSCRAKMGLQDMCTIIDRAAAETDALGATWESDERTQAPFTRTVVDATRSWRASGSTRGNISQASWHV